MNDDTRKLINEIYQRTHGHCYDGAAAGNFLREVTQALTARATPAQPVPTFKITEIHGTARVNQYGDKPHITDYHERTYTIPAQPSPSSAGDAIRALPLPEGMKGTGVATLNGSAWMDFSEPHYTAAQINKLLSEAAALAEQVQGQRQQWISVADKMPESGKRVVFAWTSQLGKARTSMGQWNERWKQVANSSDGDACEYDEELDEYYLLEGWQEWGWELEFSAYVEGEVTHWMPLPAAPSIAQDGQKSEVDHG